MKAQCDGCHKKAASVFCYTEETALCGPCDHRIHHCSTCDDHQRFLFCYPVRKHVQICDICQETKAFMFCLEHRAIMCRNCDTAQHVKHELTKKHNRFLLTGAKICTGGDKNGKESEPLGNSTDEKHDDAVAQPENDKGVSSISNINREIIMAPGKESTILDMSSDDPYGLCKNQGGEAASTFEDTDLGGYLSSLSPRRF